jgi:hypothetical protein
MAVSATSSSASGRPRSEPSNMKADRLRSRTAGWAPKSKASTLERNRKSSSPSGLIAGSTRSNANPRLLAPTARRLRMPRARSAGNRCAG